MGHESMEKIQLGEDRIQWRAFGNSSMNFLVSETQNI
jgi:hypothetical protein